MKNNNLGKNSPTYPGSRPAAHKSGIFMPPSRQPMKKHISNSSKVSVNDTTNIPHTRVPLKKLEIPCDFVLEDIERRLWKNTKNCTFKSNDREVHQNLSSFRQPNSLFDHRIRGDRIFSSFNFFSYDRHGVMHFKESLVRSLVTSATLSVIVRNEKNHRIFGNEDAT